MKDSSGWTAAIFLGLMAMWAVIVLLSPGTTSQTGVRGYQEVCVDGVVYLQFPSGVTPKYTISSEVAVCS